MRIIGLILILALAGCAASDKAVRRDGASEVRWSARPAAVAAACIAANAKKLGMSARIDKGAAPLNLVVVASYQPTNVSFPTAVTDVLTYYDEGTSLRTYVTSYAPGTERLGANLLEGC